MARLPAPGEVRPTIRSGRPTAAFGCSSREAHVAKDLCHEAARGLLFVVLNLENDLGVEDLGRDEPAGAELVAPALHLGCQVVDADRELAVAACGVLGIPRPDDDADTSGRGSYNLGDKGFLLFGMAIVFPFP